MSVRTVFSDDEKLFYITYTCYEWLPLIELTDGYDIIYGWFDYIKRKHNVQVSSYVIMPNHLHCILSFPDKNVSLNQVMREGKIYLARKILNRLKERGQLEVLELLKQGVTASRLAKGQEHVVFQRGFEAKAIVSKHFLEQKMRYIHLNPIRGNYDLVENWRDYPHSSASYYEYGLPGHYIPTHYDELG